MISARVLTFTRAAVLAATAAYATQALAQTAPSRSPAGKASSPAAAPLPSAMRMPFLLAPGTTGQAAASPGASGALAKSTAASSPALTITQVPSSTAPEIVELARALKYDPKLIYQYVHDNIEFDPVFGAMKSPVMTLADQRGSAFDQAALLVALLQQASSANAAGTPGATTPISGITYQYGAIKLSGQQFAQWLNTDLDANLATDINSVGTVLGSGGYPASFNGYYIGNYVGSPIADHISSGEVMHVWVQATVNGKTQVYDPAFKQHVLIPGGGSSVVSWLESVSGYSQSDLLGAAGVSAQSFSVSGLNRTAVRAKLQGYTSTLAAYLQANFAGKDVRDVVGGTAIIPTTFSEVGAANANLATDQAAPVSWTPGTQWAQNGYHLQLSVSLPGWSAPLTYNADDVYGRRITVVFSPISGTSNYQPVLSLDGVQQGPTGSPSTGLSLYTLYMGVTAPWDAGENTNPNLCVNQQGNPTNYVCGKQVTPNSTYLIGEGFGRVTRGTIERYRQALAAASAQNSNPSSEPVLGGTLAVIGATWQAENVTQGLLAGQIFGTNTMPIYQVGIVGQAVGATSQGPYVDLPFNITASAPRLNGSVASQQKAAQALFNNYNGVASGFEAGILRQNVGQAVSQFAAASTTYLLDAGSTGTTYLLNSSNYQSASLPAATLSAIQPYVTSSSPAYTVLVPAAQTMVGPAWSGTGFQAIAGSYIAEIISGSQAGGFSADNVVPYQAYNAVIGASTAATPTAPQAANANQTGNNTTAGAPATGAGTGTNFFGRVVNSVIGLGQAVGDPVDRQSGAYLYSHDDITVGSRPFPYGLGFQRSYSSNAAALNGPLGNGWTHNFNYNVSVNSDGFDAMGGSSPASAASAIVALLASGDISITNEAAGLNRVDLFVTTAVVQQWLIDQLVNNVVTVTEPTGVEHFVLLPNGTYAAPLGSANTLVKNADGTFQYTTPDQVAIKFDATGKLSSYTDPAGPVVTFATSGSTTTVSNNLGWSLSLNFSGPYISSVTDANGRSVSYTYANNNLATVTDTLGGKTNFSYDGSGSYPNAASHLKQVFYPASYGGPASTSAFVTNTYDSLGRVEFQADANGHQSTYYVAGSRTELIDPTGISNAWYLDGRGSVIQYTYGSGTLTAGYNLDYSGNLPTTVYTLDHAERLVATAVPPTGFPTGRTVTNTYDRWNDVVQVVDAPPAGATDPHPSGGALSARTRCFQYDPTFHKVTAATVWQTTTTPSSTCPSFTSGDHSTYGYTYDTNGRLLRQTSPSSQFWSASESKLAAPAVATGPNTFSTTPYGALETANTVSIYTYNSLGLPLTSVTGQAVSAIDGVMTSYTYDSSGNGNLTQKVVDPGSGGSYGFHHTTTYTYDGAGNVRTVTDPNANQANPVGSPTTNTYDAARELLTSTPPSSAGSKSLYAYDGMGNVLTATRSPLSGSLSPQVTTNTYTPTNKIKTATDPSGAMLAYTYDNADRVLSVTDLTGRSTSYSYDGAGRLQYVYNSGQQVERRYYLADNLMFRRDGSGTFKYFFYDGLQRLDLAKYFLSGNLVSGPYSYDQYAYNVAGKLDYHAIPSGDAINYTYNALDLMTAKGTGPSSARVNTTYAYNGSGQVANVARVLASAPTATTYPDGFDQYAFRPADTWSFLYRSDGFKAEDIFPDWKAVKYDSDGNGNRREVIWADSNTQNVNGNSTLGGEPTQYSTMNSYDPLNRLGLIQYTQVTPSAYSRAIQDSAFDPFDRETLRYLGGNPDVNNSIAWTYAGGGSGLDLASICHFTGAASCAGAPNSLQLAYGYDKAHRATSLAATAAGQFGAALARPPSAATVSYAVGGSTAYVELNQIGSAGSASLSYDSNYDLTSSPYTGAQYGGAGGDAPGATGVAKLVYDDEQQLVSASVGSDVWTYAYDPFGRRVSKTKNAVASSRTLYIQDDRGREIGEYDYQGNVLTRHIFNDAETAPVASSDPKGDLTFNRLDRVGSVVAVTQGMSPASAGENVLAQNAYLPFGATASGTLTGTSYGYAGYRIDPETGLYHTRTRYYDPRLGRFVTTDPIGFDGGMNLYAYADNDPLNQSDPSGLAAGQVANGAYSLFKSGALVPGGQASNQAFAQLQQGNYGAAALSFTRGLGEAALAVATFGQSQAAVGTAEIAANSLEGGLQGGAQSALAGPLLARHLATEEAASGFTAEGTLTQDAIAGSREIVPSSQIGNPAVPPGFSKFSTQTSQSPAGNFQTHFYMNPQTGEPFYGLDYKSIFNSQTVGP